MPLISRIPSMTGTGTLRGKRISRGSVPPIPAGRDTIPSYGRRSGGSAARNVEVEITDSQVGRVQPVAYGPQRIACKEVYGPVPLASFYLEAVYLVAEGPIESIDAVYLNGTQVYPSPPAWCSVVVRLGTTSQTEITEVSDSQWSSVYPGYALVYIKLNMLAKDVEPGRPLVEVVGRFLKVYDPRTGQTRYSANPALIVRDVMTNVEYGAGISSSLIDDTSLGALATHCDQIVGGVTEGFESTNSLTQGSALVARTTGSKKNGSYGLDCTNVQSANRQKTKNATYTAPFMVQAWVYDKGVSTPANSSLPGLCFCVPAGQEDAGKGYQAIVQTNPTSGSAQIQIRKDNNSGSPLAAVTGLTLYRQTWYRVAAYLDPLGTITMWVYDTTGALVAMAQASDTTYKSGRAGIYSYDGSYFDDVTLPDTWSEPRYQANPIFTARTDWREAINDILLTCQGRWGFWDGKFRCTYDWQGSGAFAINDEGTSGGYPILRNGDRSSLRCNLHKQDRPNLALVNVLDVSDWQTKPVRYESPGLKAGTEQPVELRIPEFAVPSPYTAYRLMKQAVLQSSRRRFGLMLAQHGLLLAPGDVGTLTSRVGPLSAQTVRVNRLTDLADGSFDVELIEHADADFVSDIWSPDSVTNPVTERLIDTLTFEDEFLTGTATSGAIGDHGWSKYGTGGNVSYRTETDHPGQVVLSPYSGVVGSEYIEIRLDASQQLFAENSKYRAEFIFNRAAASGSSSSARLDIGIKDSGLYVANDTGYIWLFGSNTGIVLPTATWARLTMWCSGDGTLYAELAFGTTTVTGSKAVSGTTANQYLMAKAAAYYDGASQHYANLYVDRAGLTVGAQR